jgi:hypothetical protein
MKHETGTIGLQSETRIQRQPKYSRCIFISIAFTIPAILLTAKGFWLGGWPAPNPNQDVEITQRRFPREMNEIDWRKKRSQKMNDPTLWNEYGQIVLLVPPEERAETQEKMIKDGLLAESARLRALTTAEQTEMDSLIAEKHRKRLWMEFSETWAFFGLPLCLLATAFGFASIWRTIGNRCCGRPLIVYLIACLFVLVLNVANFFLTGWGASR